MIAFENYDSGLVDCEQQLTQGTTIFKLHSVEIMQVKNKKIIIKRLHEKFCYLAVSYLVTMRLMRWLKQFPALSKTDFEGDPKSRNDGTAE